MFNVVGFSRRMRETALLKLRDAADRHSIETIRTLGIEARFHCTSPKEMGRLRTIGGEPVILDFLRTRVRAGDSFYDIGGNIGFYSILAAFLVGPEGSVVAFEPEAENFARLQANVLLNDLKNVVVCPFALSDHNGAACLRLQSHSVGEGAHALVDGAADGTRVFLLTLDSAMRMFDLPPPNHVKMDVETHEEPVLAGMPETLASPALRTVALEAHYYAQLPDRRVYQDDAELAAKRGRIVSLFERNGFRLDVEQLTAEGEVRFAHMLFVRA